MTNRTLQALFVAFAFLAQVLLIINFAARNWRPLLERRYGWLIYAMGIPGIGLGILFLARAQPWTVVAAPLVYAIWAAFGYYVDMVRQIKWRSPPRWPVFIPYVALFMAGQFLFWIPLWYVGLAYWIIYTVMYFLNTGLNIYSHRKPAR
jgi:hypothetical protein